MTLTSSLRHLLAALFVIALSSPASSQSYPDRAITLVVPFPAGAATDRLARGVANELSKRLGQSVIVEISAAHRARSPVGAWCARRPTATRFSWGQRMTRPSHRSR